MSCRVNDDKQHLKRNHFSQKLTCLGIVCMLRKFEMNEMEKSEMAVESRSCHFMVNVPAVV